MCVIERERKREHCISKAEMKAWRSRNTKESDGREIKKMRQDRNSAAV